MLVELKRRENSKLFPKKSLDFLIFHANLYNFYHYLSNQIIKHLITIFVNLMESAALLRLAEPEGREKEPDTFKNYNLSFYNDDVSQNGSEISTALVD